MIDQTRFFVTTREKIQPNIDEGTINANDLVICSDTHELVYVNSDLSYFAITTTGNGMNELVEDLEDKLTEIREAAENSLVTGVKGSSERVFRRGNVNLGTDDIGLGNVTNHTQVRGLPLGTTEGHIVVWGPTGFEIKDSGIDASNGNISNVNKLIMNSSVPGSENKFELTISDTGQINIVQI